jgi:hypothetical protein
MRLMLGDVYARFRAADARDAAIRADRKAVRDIPLIDDYYF